MKSARLLALILGLLTMAAGIVHAHPLDPGYLELTEEAGGTWLSRFRVPMAGTAPLPLSVRYPADCTVVAAGLGVRSGTFEEHTARLTCAEPLSGRAIAIEGLNKTRTDVIVRTIPLSGPFRMARASVTAPGVIIEAPGASGLIGTYFRYGFEHIREGYDHLLLVAGLFLLRLPFFALIKTVTAFTLAHSVTLAAAVLGWQPWSQGLTEVLIALSVVFLARDVLAANGASLIHRRPWLIAFAFGLLHGFGFAGSLRDIGIPEGHIWQSLLGFNLGVEAGQVLVALALSAVAWMLRQMLREPVMARGAAFGALAIGGIGAYWFLTRISDLFLG